MDPQTSPFETFAHLKESLASYLETAYKISHPAIYSERGDLLRLGNAIAQEPFIETTPSYPTTRTLRQLVGDIPGVTEELVDLVSFGTPLGRKALLAHQEEALRLALGQGKNLVVATGTGSGKTEIFVIPILSRLLRESTGWTPPRGPGQPGAFNARTENWEHSRRHESRQAALRAIILYPMNALVSDQMRRLRRILGSELSEQWQRSKLRGNLIHFGMYTSEAEPTGHWAQPRKPQRWNSYFQEIASVWSTMPENIRSTGGWPRPNGPEMLCRWDMHLAPPDILVTNYSMLEYMLVRPIEAPIFNATARWLREDPSASFTLVLDEAHTYTGARGTEIAHLLRRLKERLDLSADDARFRCIATSASLPASEDAHERVIQFASGLFGEPPSRFSVITTQATIHREPIHAPTLDEMKSFEFFADKFDALDPIPAIRSLATALGKNIDSDGKE